MGIITRTLGGVPAIRAERIWLWADGAMIGSAGIAVAGDDFPEVVMVNGEPFIRDETIAPLTWRKVRPYRINNAGG